MEQDHVTLVDAAPPAVGAARAAIPLRRAPRSVLHGIHDTTSELVGYLRTLDRTARHAGRTIRTDREYSAVAWSFWRVMDEISAVEPRLAPDEVAETRTFLQGGLNPWLLRSRYWNRSYTKPHGFAGDYRMLEWMYDLERDPCADSTQPAVVNALDHLYKTVHSVQAVWHRRMWFRELLREEALAARRPLRVLDVACGGSRYLRDLMTDVSADGTAFDVTFVDQDPSALAHVQAWLPDGHRARTVCAPIKRLPELVPVQRGDGEGYDVVLSTGLFDYLGDDEARALLDYMAAQTRCGGRVVVCNFAPEDRSRVVKDWVADWILRYRNERQLAAIYQDRATTFERSPDGGLVYASVVARTNANGLAAAHPHPTLGTTGPEGSSK